MSLKGSTAEFPLDVLIPLLRDQKKTGELALRSPGGEGALGFSDGRVVVAVYGDEKPIAALGAIFEMATADFEFTPWDEAPPANLEGDLDELLRKAREHREWMASVREIIPHDRMRFRLSERAAEQGAVTFTPDRWRVVLAVNGTRDVNAIATNLHIDRDAALDVLSGLVREGVIDTVDPAAEAAPMVEPTPAPEPEPQYTAPPEPEYVAPEPEPEPAPSEWPAPAPEPAAPAQEFTPPPPAQDWGAPPPAQDWGAPAPAQEMVPPPMPEPEAAPAPAMDDRLAALFGTPAPAETPPAPSPDQWSAPAPSEWTTPAPAADQWTTPTPAAPETPAPDLTADPRLGALTMPPAEPAAPNPAQAEISPYPFGSTSAPANEWAPPAPVEAPPQKKKGLFGRFGGGAKEEAAAPTAPAAPGRASSRVGQLAAFSNALLTEYNSGQYGKQRIDDRMPSLLMRVDEQADPIDRPLPVLDDRLDVEALDRVSLPEAQAAPYLAMLVTTIYGDAEKAFGKDKAKKGYKAAQQQVFAGDTSSLAGPDLTGKLPKV